MKIATRFLAHNPNLFFIDIVTMLIVDSSAFEIVDLFGEFDLPVIAVVEYYEDD